MPREVVGRDGNFRSVLIPCRRSYTADIEEVIRPLFVEGVSQRKVGEALETLYGTKFSASTIGRMAEVGVEGVKSDGSREVLGWWFVASEGESRVSKVCAPCCEHPHKGEG